jgi:translation initiation factor IF-2
MSEIKLPRLLAATKEFNVGAATITDFLKGKGLADDSLTSSSKLTEVQYRALQQEFHSDKAAKSKADQIEIPKGAGAEARRRREEEEAATQRREAARKKEDPAPKPAEASQPEKQAEPVSAPPVTAAPAAEAPRQEEPVKLAPEAITPPPVAAPEVQPEPTPRQEEPVAAQPRQEEPAAADNKEKDIVKIEAPELEGPRILNKIDLSAIDSSTRPKKNFRKEEVPEKPEPKAAAEEARPEKPAEQPVQPRPEVKATAPEVPTAPPEAGQPEPTATAAEPEAPPVIENIQAEKLTGPKILGKIELPINSDTRPKPASRDEKRKRKRIPLDKKGEPGQQGGQGQQQGGGFNRGGQQGGGQQGGGGFNRGGQQGGGGFNRGGGQQGAGGFNRGGQQTPSNPNRQRPALTKGGAAARHHAPGDKEINQKEIQEKIKETQAKLSGGGGRTKGTKAKYRREKRQERDVAMHAAMGEDNKLQVTEFVTVSELASLMDVSFADIISKCMGLGIMVSINQRLDAEVIELVAGEFGYEVEFMGVDDVEEAEEETTDEPGDLVERAPIVTIMGHVDHGKTSLLDYIRSANVVAGEAGGITQHIGAYEVTTASGKPITFLDTPGHEAFTAMRARGAKVTDIAVIVVAADDAVMPQTREAISHAQAAGVPMIFAVNKIDKDGANPQKIYEQLANMNILVESWGGKFQSQELSAKKGLNVDLLLEKILLEAELLELKANPEKEATGTIIEASLDKGRGYVATVLVQNGTLSQGDIIVSGQNFGRVKAMFNERNGREQEAGPSTPVQILGLNGAPQAGEKFKVYLEESDAKEVANKRAQILREQGLRARKHITLDEIGRRLALGNFKELNVIIKGDVDGSVEALSDSLQKLSTEEIAVRVVHKAVGQISESDVLLATASDAIVIGFNVRPSTQANRLAENEGVQIKMYSIIYNAIEEVKSAMEGLLEPKVEEKEVATVEVREVYKFDKATVAGCYVQEGRIKRDSKIRLFRDGILIYPRQEGGFGELGSLKRFKDDVKEVGTAYECGLTVKNFADLNVGDTIVAYEELEVKRTL